MGVGSTVAVAAGSGVKAGAVVVPGSSSVVGGSVSGAVVTIVGSPVESAGCAAWASAGVVAFGCVVTNGVTTPVGTGSEQATKTRRASSAADSSFAISGFIRYCCCPARYPTVFLLGVSSWRLRVEGRHLTSELSFFDSLSLAGSSNSNAACRFLISCARARLSIRSARQRAQEFPRPPHPAPPIGLSAERIHHPSCLGHPSPHLARTGRRFAGRFSWSNTVST